MLRRTLCLAAAISLSLVSGCLHWTGTKRDLEEAWSFSHTKAHADRFDWEMQMLKDDIDDIFFGIENRVEKPVWNFYDD